MIDLFCRDNSIMEDKMSDHGEPPVSGATWVEDYERAGAHVSGYWRGPNGEHLEPLEQNSPVEGARPALTKKNARSNKDEDIAKQTEIIHENRIFDQESITCIRLYDAVEGHPVDWDDPNALKIGRKYAKYATITATDGSHIKYAYGDTINLDQTKPTEAARAAKARLDYNLRFSDRYKNNLDDLRKDRGKIAKAVALGEIPDDFLRNRVQQEEVIDDLLSAVSNDHGDDVDNSSPHLRSLRLLKHITHNTDLGSDSTLSDLKAAAVIDEYNRWAFWQKISDESAERVHSAVHDDLQESIRNKEQLGAYFAGHDGLGDFDAYFDACERVTTDQFVL